MVDELDLFSSSGAAPTDGAWTVGQVTRRARQLIESGLHPLWIQGEVTGFKTYRSGHWYFSLRDAEAQLRCVMWRLDAQRVRVRPEEGMQMFVEGRPTVWEERGEFRLTVKRMIPTDRGGVWERQLREAKAALQRDGLLDPARKRPLPEFPERIGLVTSEDGAALHDVLTVLRRRWPAVRVFLVPARVQGDTAVRELCRGLQRLNRMRIDLAIVGRGGGSREDLWAFNDERVARAVAEVAVPVISAVGHEEDVSLTDLVADLRAPTPSAAAEAAVPDRAEAVRVVDALARQLGRSLASRTRLGRERLARTGDRLVAGMQAQVEARTHRLANLSARLEALSPLRVLARGFSMARDADGRVLRTVGQFEPGSPFRLTVSDGDVWAEAREGPDA